MPLMALTGGNLAGARIEAMVFFPAAIQKAFSRWQVGSATIDDRPVQVVQGTNAGQPPVNFYFDESGLLVRLVRWNRTAVGTVPTQIDYADYREVAGVKMPFRSIVTWTGGQNTIELREVRPNVAIDRRRDSPDRPHSDGRKSPIVYRGLFAASGPPWTNSGRPSPTLEIDSSEPRLSTTRPPYPSKFTLSPA